MKQDQRFPSCYRLPRRTYPWRMVCDGRKRHWNTINSIRDQEAVYKIKILQQHVFCWWTYIYKFLTCDTLVDKLLRRRMRSCWGVSFSINSRWTRRWRRSVLQVTLTLKGHAMGSSRCCILTPSVFYTLSKATEAGSFTVVYRSEVSEGENPIWSPMTISIRSLCVSHSAFLSLISCTSGRPFLSWAD